MARYDKLERPEHGTRIEFEEGVLVVPDDPVIPFIEGDGVGPEIWAATRLVLDAAVEKAFKGKRQLHWFEVFAGDKAVAEYGEGVYLPDDTLQAIQEFRVGLKGPLTTPVAGGIRSLNVALRQRLDLYASVRPSRWYEGVPSPVKHPDKLDIVLFRENTEDVYAGIEFAEGSDEARRLLSWLRTELNKVVRLDSGLGIKPISSVSCRRLIRRAIRYALDHKRESVTLVHKGNIMKFTEGAFRDWGYKLAKDEFPEETLTEDEVADKHGGKVPKGKVMIKDRLADGMFQQLLLRPEEYDVIATTNLNGDYLSHAASAQVGGMGMAPGANFGDEVALFEATHGTATKYAGQDKVNPSSLILSGTMLLDHLGWTKAAALVVKGLEGAIGDGQVTYDLARHLDGKKPLACSAFGNAIIEHMT